MIVGMDFGTTNSGMAVHDGRHLELIPLDRAAENPRVARTALYITNQRRVYVGREAIEKYYEQNINRKVRYERVWVGEIALEFAELPVWVRDISIEKDVLAPGRLFLSFKTGLKSSTYVGTTVGTHFYFLEDVVALYLYTARLRAEAHLGQPVRKIVLGRPVRFALDDEGDRLAEQRLVHAAFRAGYDEVWLQFEPIAAAYFYESSLQREENVLIFDFGGGTLDVTVARLGNPKTRAILANDGIPVAGDVFDQRLVRHCLPPHFGQGSHYQGDRGRRPVPASFFEAFTDWQELLELNRPKLLRTLEEIAANAERKRDVNMLISLIRSSYGLKMYDAAEAAKRELSSQSNALIRLDGPGFDVTDLVTRPTFESLIKPDVAAIGELVDDVVQRAGLRHEQIDTVIRTGGSSQIPAFINLLGERFGAERVRALDTFSSVTAGLGILAEQVDRVEMRHYTRDGWGYGSRVRKSERRGVPPVDLDLMKRFIDVEEETPGAGGAQISLLSVNPLTHYVVGCTQPYTAFNNDADSLSLRALELEGLQPGVTLTGAPDQRVLLMTSEYRFLLRTVGAVADLSTVGLSLAELEGFQADRFGREVLSGFAPWDNLPEAERIMLISSGGEARVMPAPALIEQLDQLHPTQLGYLSGTPVALLPATGEIVLLTSTGGVARLETGDLPRGQQRVLRVRQSEDVHAAIPMQRGASLLMMAANGYGVRVALGKIPRGKQSAKVLGQRRLRAHVLLPADCTGGVWATTTQRVLPLDLEVLPPVGAAHAKPARLLRLKKDEEIVALHCVPVL